MLLFVILYGLSASVTAQDVTIDDPAEVVALIDEPNNEIPAIKVTEYTTINVTVRDAFGIPWEQLSTNMPILAKYIWPILHPSWKPFLGFSSLRFETEIVNGDERGWFHYVEPSAIANADQGRIYNLTLYAKTDDISVDYAVVIGIKVTRLNVYGEEFGVSYIYVPVKSSQLNNVRMNLADTSKEATPKSYVTYEGQITNYGYYRGMFELEFEHDEDLTVSTPNQLIVLESGETKNVQIQVLTAEKLFDVGTPYEIIIRAKSSGDPEPVHVGTIRVISQGLYISPLALIIAVPIIILLLIVFIVFYILKDKRDREIFGKPDKPWDLPEEKEYLKKLKKEDTEKYQQVMDMMKQEYQSSLLWWKSVQQKSDRKTGFSFLDVFSKLRNKPKETKETTEEKEEEKQKTKVVKEKPKKSKSEKEQEKPAEEEEESKEKPSEKETASTKGKILSSSIFKKLSSGFKKWFTVPEEEKQKMQQAKEEKELQEQAKQEQKKKELEETVQDILEEPEDDYEQELDRIEEQQKNKQSQKAKEQKKVEKQKAMKRIKRAEEKQRNKVNK